MVINRFPIGEDSGLTQHLTEFEYTDREPDRFSAVETSAMLEPEDDYNILLLPRRPPVEDPPGNGDPEAQVHSLKSPRVSAGGGQDVAYAKPREGIWKRQMLVDRSLRGMALLTTIFALTMMILCAISYVQESNTLSGGNCNSVAVTGQVVHLFINIASTMVLGMSNTYQQLATSLSIDDIKWALANAGDARVGTNSPFSIRFKRTGRWRAWMAWILLISTSLPVHLLANSVVGPSYELPPLPVTRYNLVDQSSDWLYGNTECVALGCSSTQGLSHVSSCEVCYIAAASGYVFHLNRPSAGPNAGVGGIAASYETTVLYSSNFTEYCKFSVKTMSAEAAQASYCAMVEGASEIVTYSPNLNSCSSTYTCVSGDLVTPQCGLNVRVEAALILAICLVIKALYMTIFNIKTYRRTKTQCITFGDVIVASAIDPNLRVRNECLVNAGEAYRQEVGHTCHKHCKDKMPSTSGDGLGHCQKCSKHNAINKAADLPTPVLSTKYKKSLLSNLGSTALIQMILLMFCATIMLGCSLVIAVFIGLSWNEAQIDYGRYNSSYYSGSLSNFITSKYGGFGGFNTSIPLVSLPANNGSSEMLSFWVSNGTQLIFSLLYLLLIYNITLISMEHDWGKFETALDKLRCTLVTGSCFRQSYTLQLPKRVLFPAMVISAVMHWLLGQSISTVELVWQNYPASTRQAMYIVVYAVYPVWLSTALIIAITSTCWWAFTYTREGFMPQMYGSIRTCCAATTELDDFRSGLLKWGDLGMGEKFRHAGFSADPVSSIVPAELYA